MKRRSFIRNTAVSGMALTGLSGTMAASASEAKVSNSEKFKLNYAPHAGMFKNSVGDDFIDQIKFMADLGFTAIEDNGMMNRDAAMQTKIGETLAKLDMTMGVFVVDKGGNMASLLAAIALLACAFRVRNPQDHRTHESLSDKETST